MRLRRFKRRLFWTGVILALTLIWLTVQVLCAVKAVLTAARSIGRFKTVPMIRTARAASSLETRPVPTRLGS
jgi:hypothetical protein